MAKIPSNSQGLPCTTKLYFWKMERESSKHSARLSIWEKVAKQEKENDYKLSKTVLEQIVKEAFDVFDPEGVGSIWKG